MRPAHRLLPVLLAVAAVAGCGDERDPGGGADPAFKATEEHEVALGGVRYRVTKFRELNPHSPPDSTFYQGPPAPEGEELYAAFVRACNTTDQPQKTAPTMRLRQPLGDLIDRLQPAAGNEIAYRQTTLDPGDCTPRAGSVADQTADGQVVTFSLTLEQIRERPLSLVIPPAAGDDRRSPVRVELDL